MLLREPGLLCECYTSSFATLILNIARCPDINRARFWWPVQCFVSMWLVRRTSGEPVFFQCAVLPLEDYPATIRGGAPDALPEPTASGTTATVNAQGQRTIEAAPSDVLSGVQELLNAASNPPGDRVLIRNAPAPLQQQQQSASVPPDAGSQPQQQRLTVPE